MSYSTTLAANSNSGNEDKNYLDLEVSEESYRFLEDLTKKDPDLKFVNNMLKTAVYYFVSHENDKGNNEMSFYLLNGKGIVNDIHISDNIVIDFIEATQRIYCHYHKFLYSECPHTLWVKWQSQFSSWVDTEHKTDLQPLIDVDANHRRIMFIRILKELYDDAMRKRERLGLYSGLSDGDFLINIALSYYH